MSEKIVYTTWFDQEICHKIELLPEVSFYGILLALIRRADTPNLERLELAFPEVVKEARIRYHNPGGTLDIEEWLAVFKEESRTIPREYLENWFKEARRDHLIYLHTATIIDPFSLKSGGKLKG